VSGDVAAAVVVRAVDRWIDTVLMQRALGAGDSTPAQ